MPKAKKSVRSKYGNQNPLYFWLILEVIPYFYSEMLLNSFKII